MTVITAADVEKAKEVIVLGPRDVVTPLARDRAKELNIRIDTGGAGACLPARAVSAPLKAQVPAMRAASQPARAARPPPLPPSGALYRRGAPMVGVALGSAAGSDLRPKAAVVGAGHVGSMVALRLAECDQLSSVTLIDVVPGLAEGLALDMWHGAALRGFSTRIEGSNDMAALAGADYVVVTAGRPRQPGMSRTDLTSANAEIMRGVAAAVRSHVPEAVVVVVTNPLEEMTHVMAQASGLPDARVIGMAGVLDSARFRSLVGLTGIATPEQVSAHALGSHGPEMVIPLSHALANGVPLEQLLEPEALAAIVERTRDSGAEVVKLLQKGSAYFSPGDCAAAMVRAMVLDTRQVLSACVRSGGSYGLVDTRVGLPVRLTRSGVAEIVRLDLRPAELQALREAAVRIAGRIRELG